MKHLRIIFSFLAWLLVAGMVATPLQHMGVPPIISFVSILAVTLFCTYLDMIVPFTSRRLDHRCDPTVDVNIWAREIIKRLFKNNAFLNYAKSEDQFVMGGAVVLIPQPGARPTVVKNRSAFPATAVRRSDSVISYLLDEYSTDPSHVTLNELATISYDKMQSVITDLFGYLMQDVADDLLMKWAEGIPSSNIIYTSGVAAAAMESGQTGNRLAMVWQNLRDAQTLMNKQNVLREGRVAIIEDNMFSQFFDSVASTQYKDFDRNADPKEGVVGRLFGFDIMTRSSVAIGAASLDTGTLNANALGQATASDDDVVCLCYQTDTVARAAGSVHLFNRANDPLYYGDINSTSIRFGGRVRRADYAGIVAIKQGKPA